MHIPPPTLKELKQEIERLELRVKSVSKEHQIAYDASHALWERMEAYKPECDALRSRYETMVKEYEEAEKYLEKMETLYESLWQELYFMKGYFADYVDFCSRWKSFFQRAFVFTPKELRTQIAHAQKILLVAEAEYESAHQAQRAFNLRNPLDIFNLESIAPSLVTSLEIAAYIEMRCVLTFYRYAQASRELSRLQFKLKRYRANKR